MVHNSLEQFRVVIVSHVPLVRAVVTLPVNDARVASAALRGRLQLLVERSGAEPDWDTLHVEYPSTYRDARGKEWFEWVATVKARPPRRDPDSSA